MSFRSPKTYRPLLSEGAASRNILHNYTARDASSGKCTSYEGHFNGHKRLKPVGTHITGACSLCSQNIVAALMVAGVMRVVCVTVLSSKHLETVVRSVSTHSIEHNTVGTYE